MPNYTAPQRGSVALLTVNAQRDFTIKGSPLKACGVEPAISAMERLVAGFRQAGAPVIHAVRLYRPDGSNVDIFRRQAVEEGLRVLMPGTAGVELIEAIRPSRDTRLDPSLLLSGEPQAITEDEWAIYKPRWGAFHETGLDAHLKALGITTLVICGCNYNTSGRATVYEAGARDYRVILATDALTGAQESSVCEMGRIGVYLMPSDHCLRWLDGGQGTSAAA